MLSLLYLLVKAQWCFVTSSCLFLDEKTVIEVWFNPGLNLTIFPGTGPKGLVMIMVEKNNYDKIKNKNVYLQNICKMKGDPCPATENKSCQVGFTDKRYRCVCRDGYRHRKHSTDQSDQCVGKIKS